MSEQGNKPVKEFRVSGGISAAVWRSTATIEGRTVVRHSVRFQKRYRDNKTGAWADSQYYYRKDLPLLLLAIEDAFRYVATIDGGGDEADASGTSFDADP